MPDTEREPLRTHTEQFSIADVAPSDRLAFWTRIGSEVFRDEIIVTPRPDSECRGQLVRRTYADMLITQVETSPATVRGTPRSRSASESEHATLLLQDVGTTDTVFGGAQLRLDAGTAAVTLPQPYSIVFKEPARLMILKMPAARLGARLGDLARLVGTRIEADDTVLLTEFLRTLLTQEASSSDPGWSEAIGDIALDLIALAYRRHRHTESVSSTRNERWRRVVREFVETHLGDPALGAAMIASRLGVTPRYVQVAFASMGTTATEYIRARRLEMAAQLLTTGAGEPIAEVAYRVGFADLSYFYRSFRRRYGLSPKRYAAR